jgi:hypothetical protein
MQHVEGSGMPVLYIGRTVLKDQTSNHVSWRSRDGVPFSWACIVCSGYTQLLMSAPRYPHHTAAFFCRLCVRADACLESWHRV